MNAFGAAYVAFVTAHDSHRQRGPIPACGRPAVKQRGSLDWRAGATTVPNHGIRDCTGRELKTRDCLRD